MLNSMYKLAGLTPAESKIETSAYLALIKNYNSKDAYQERIILNVL